MSTELKVSYGSCRFCTAEPVAVFRVPEGCACYPDDREQALCMQHIVGESSIGGMILIKDLTVDSKFTKWWRMRIIDAGRTGIRASHILVEHPPLFYDGNDLCGPAGAFLQMIGGGPSNWVLCCPGCQKASGPKKGAKWTIESGSFDKIEDLTLSPSIEMKCCGWHGYLTNGIFSLKR